MDRASRHFYEFDTFRINVGDRQLVQNGTRIALTPKVFDVLLFLVENAGRTVGKEELMEHVWTDSFVEEGNLNRNVSTLRKVLSDDALHPKFIKTAPKIGYSFVGEVNEVWEDDETILVENRTRYHLALREEKIKGLFGSRLAIAMIAAVALVGVSLVWMWSRSQRNEARSMAEERTDARDLYEQGRALWRSRSGDELHRGTILLEQAVNADPNLAIAHAALADAYAFDYTNWRRAEMIARSAINLDPTLGEPHASIGFVRLFWEWRLRDAETEFKRAIELSPKYATAHQWYASMLMAADRRNAAYAEIRMALDLEPDSIAINSDMCRTLYMFRRYDEAISQGKRTLELDAKSFNAHRCLYEAYGAVGKHDDAVRHYIEAERLAGVSSEDVLNNLVAAYRDNGMSGFRRALLPELESGSKLQSYRLAQNYAALGDKESALRWLADSYARHEFDFLFFYVDPAFEGLRGDPRFEEYINRLIPPE